jgi:hypothetical protein
MRERTHLVCQHLENISRGALEEYQDIIRAYVRRRHGVYTLYRRGKLYYVGLAGNLRRRLHRHLKDRHGASWDRFSVYLTVGDVHLRELEALVLRIVRPSGNKQKGKFPQAEDMRRRFARDIQMRQRAELRDILGRKMPQVIRRVRKAGTEGRAPILAEYGSGGFRLRARHKGNNLAAWVRRDGRIRFNSKIFTSPSLAAAAACKRRSCDGWTFWHYERAPGDWVLLDEMRKR